MASEVLPTPPMPCTAARPTACVTAAGLSCMRMASSRVKFVSAACEARDARWHPDERSWWRWRCLRLALSSSDDAPLAFLGVCDAHEVLIDHVGEETAQRHILAAQDDDVPLLGALRNRSASKLVNSLRV